MTGGDVTILNDQEWQDRFPPSPSRKLVEEIDEETRLNNLVADLRQKLQDERDGAEEALKAKDEVIADLQLRCSNLERELERWWEMDDAEAEAEADAQEGLLTAYEIAGLP